MMARIFTQQYQVVKDFNKALEKLNEREPRVPKTTLENVAEVLGQILERRTEIEEVEEEGNRTSEQVSIPPL